MPTVVWPLLGVLVLVTMVALVLSVRTLVRRLGRLAGDLDDLQRELTPALRQLEVDGEVTATELAAIGDRLDERARLAATRRKRRWRPGPS
ncbi:hypothetical protein [Nitriliruptor alkaliphilus]|uniref:hypothetical protein n=1 Tax=Nitriliruptor alkaliphilus TaxID=427918 RepID=UPI000695D05A|nr:hypothetical protein [Nitriliruptor alkaliphilus]